MNSRWGGPGTTPSKASQLITVLPWARPLLWGAVLLLGFWPSAGLWGQAQQLDTDTRPRASSLPHGRPLERYSPNRFQPGASRSNSQRPNPAGKNLPGPSPSATGAPTADLGNYSMAKPLTATVTHTLYLPPAMYGQWDVTGTLIESNAPDFFSPSVSDIWLLEREGDQVTVTNPVNGANATISVDKAEGNQATFHRSGTAGKHAIYQEIPTLTVHGDTFSGQSLNKLQNIKEGRVVSEVYGVYRLEATRISGARARFHPESEQPDPDLQIEEIHH
jgi:hypothetical protein